MKRRGDDFAGTRAPRRIFLTAAGSRTARKCSPSDGYANMCSMRWESQNVDADDAGRLPGMDDDAVVRRFDAPGGAGHPLPRDPHQVGTEPRPGRVPAAVRVDGQPVSGVARHACVYCFARPTHEYLDMNAGRDFEREIVVKVNVPEVLRAELARPSWKGDRVALGTNTDPYQWVEGRYKLMRGIWEALRDFRNPCSVLTKSPLVLRDLDLLKEIAAVTEITACLSVPTLDEKAWRATEPHTPNPKARLEAVAELNRNGIPTGVLVAPLMPGINDGREQVERIVEAATEANATYIGGQTLFLRGSVREVFFDWLREHRPDLLPRYERLYAKGAYLSPAERRKIEEAAGAPWVSRDYPADRYRHRRGFRARRRLRPRNRRSRPSSRRACFELLRRRVRRARPQPPERHARRARVFRRPDSVRRRAAGRAGRAPVLRASSTARSCSA